METSSEKSNQNSKADIVVTSTDSTVDQRTLAEAERIVNKVARDVTASGDNMRDSKQFENKIKQRPNKNISNRDVNISAGEKTAPKTDGSNTKEDESSPNDDDVPQDFFDDFSNPDFMEGLNIVDAWDDQPEGEEHATDRNKKIDVKKQRQRHSRSKTDDRKRPLRRSRSRDRRHISREKKQLPEYNDKRKSADSKKEKPKDDSDLRRDPAKTKRDLEIYKVKCDKDKEQKTITEKLKVVETGLVPPGMEMDVDIEEVLKKAKEEKREKCPELDDSWQTHPNTKSPNTVYPDLKPSAIFPSDAVTEARKYHLSKSKRKSRSSLDHVIIGDSSELRGAAPDRKRRSSSFQRSWHKDPFHDKVRHDSRGRRNKSPLVGRIRRIASPLPLASTYLSRKSPIRKSPSRDRMYGRRSISRERKRRTPTPRGRIRRSSSRGPYNKQRRSRSLSEREAWIRDPKRAWRRSRSRSRTRSPKRGRYVEKKGKKMSFIEEMRQLLGNSVSDATVPSSGMHMWPQNTHNQPPHNIIIPSIPIPIPVPPPNDPPPFQFQTQSQSHPPTASVPFDMYDQQFFIGDMPLQNTPTVIAPRSVEGTNPIPSLHPIIPHGHPMGSAVVPAPNPEISNIIGNRVPAPPPTVALSIPKVPVQNSQGTQPGQSSSTSLTLDVFAKIRSLSSQAKSTTNNEAKKLYEDKKISLSDFLTMTTKFEDGMSPTVNLPKKIGVISRCQDVVKQLDGGVFNGRFIVKPQNREKSPEVTNRSPLLVTHVKYKSTCPLTAPRKEGFGNIMKKLLSAAGIAVDTIDLEDDEEKCFEGPPSPPAPPQITNKKSRNFQAGSTSSVTPSKHLMKMVQTDPFKCKACEERNDIIYIHSASQCSVSVRTIATQTEDPVKDMLKNKSLAALTPAQLLMLKEKEKGTNARIMGDEDRSLGNNHDHGSDRFGIPNYRGERSPPTRITFSPARKHFSPPRNTFSPPRIHYSPPGRYSPPPKHERPTYVPTVPHLPPKRPYVPDPFSVSNARPPFTDSTDRYFRR